MAGTCLGNLRAVPGARHHHRRRLGAPVGHLPPVESPRTRHDRRLLFRQGGRTALACAAALAAISCGGPDQGLYARIVTDQGRLLIRLHHDRAPLPVAAFVGLAEGVLGPAGFYDGSRVAIASEQLVMAGETGPRGAAGIDWDIPDQFHPDLRHDRAGVVSLFTEGPHTGSARFVITRRAAPELDGVYPVFGQVVDGQEALARLRPGHVIERVRIVRVGAEARRYRVDREGFAELRTQVAQELLRALAERNRLAFAEFRRRWPDAVATESGLLYVVHRRGSGPPPDFGAKVLLRYTGRLLDGAQFGASGSEPTEFTIGAVVKGLEEMLLSMSRGERRTVLIPPDLGYGAMGVPGTVPPRAFLIFDVELVDFTN